MSYEDLLSQIYAELPHLKGQLHAPKVVYVKAQGKVYITFESGVLVEYASFIKMERLLRRIFPEKPLQILLHTGGFPGLYTKHHRVEFEKELLDGVTIL